MKPTEEIAMHDIDRTQLEYGHEAGPFQHEEFEFNEFESGMMHEELSEHEEIQLAHELKTKPTIPLTMCTPTPGIRTAPPASPMATPIISDTGQITIPTRIPSITAATNRIQNPPYSTVAICVG